MYTSSNWHDRGSGSPPTKGSLMVLDESITATPYALTIVHRPYLKTFKNCCWMMFWMTFLMMNDGWRFGWLMTFWMTLLEWQMCWMTDDGWRFLDGGWRMMNDAWCMTNFCLFVFVFYFLMHDEWQIIVLDNRWCFLDDDLMLTYLNFILLKLDFISKYSAHDNFCKHKS